MIFPGRIKVALARLRVRLGLLEYPRVGALSRFQSYPLVRRLRELIFQVDVEPSEIYSIFGALAWAILLTLPGDLLATNPGFSRVAHAGPAWAWASAMWALCLYQTWALLRARYPYRRWGLFVGVFLWAALARLIGEASPHFGVLPFSTGYLVYGIFSLGCTWGYLRMTLMAHLDHKADLARKRLLAAARKTVPSP